MFKRQFYHETCWNIMFSYIFRGEFLSATETRPLLPKSLASSIVGDDIVTYICILYTIY
jgi:hypothetical protein